MQFYGIIALPSRRNISTQLHSEIAKFADS